MIFRKSFILTACTSIALGAAAQSSGYLIEAEAFQFKGKWVVEKSSECLGTAMLRVYQDTDNSAESDALTVVNITEAGTYQVWTRSRDYAVTARPRTFTLSVDGTAMTQSGSHSHEGFYWENVGSVDLARKQTMLRLHDSGGYFGRCDAILLINDPDVNPNQLTNTQVARWRKSPVTMDYSTGNAPALDADRTITSGYTTLASASNGEIRLSFVRLEDGTIVCKNDFYAADSWRRFHSSAEDNRIALVSNEKSVNVDHNQYYPAWDSCTASRELQFEGSTYPVTIDGDRTNPYYTGVLTEARATAVTKTAANTIKVTYDCGGYGSLTGLWTVPESGTHVNVTLRFTPAADGSYSLALHGAKGMSQESVSRVLLPPMFQDMRTPATPLMMFSSMMTQCVSIVETQMSFGSASAFVAADLDTFTKDWGSYDYSPIGFTLRNSANAVQPVAFAPLPGMKDATVKAGKIIEARFVAGITPADCAGTLEYVSDNVFNVSDYRRQDSQSLTTTLHNVTALIKDTAHNGWNAGMKGPWDIECDGNTSPTVVQSSPLSLVGVSMLTHDEAMYTGYALPAIEYVLSRNGFRTDGNAPARLDPMHSQFPTTTYEGINTLTGGLNPWLEAIALPDGQLRTANGYFASVQPYTQALSAYRLTGNDSWLTQAETLAGQQLSESVNADTQAYAPGTFYNSQMYADWQSMLDMYAATGDERYAEAAAHGAVNTLAGIKTWPRVADGEQTVHPGGRYDGVTSIWWKGTERYRLGFPRTDGDAPEHSVEARKVSSVGLSIEQPATYFLRTAGQTVRPVYMSNWAPALLRLSEATGKPIYETYARNAVTGRTDNYPGYYATGYTDIPCSARFPYDGPDVSSIYYHHIPAYLGLIQDYLVSEIIARSNGEIDFPHARQEGFVWFSNNIYGSATGTVHGHDARLWMPEGMAEADRPEVNLLTARGNDRLFVMLTCEADEACPTTVTLADMICRQSASTEVTVYAADGSESHLTLDGSSLTVTVPARKVVTLALAMDWADEISTAQLPALTDGLHVIDTGTVAGKVYLYRIRSPFGWDSVYGFAECSSVDGLSIDVTCNSSHTLTSTWPYEWSFAGYGYDEAIDVKITMMLNGVAVKSIDESFNNNISEISVIPAEPSTPARQGIYRLDGIKVSNTDRPGFYIVNGHKFVQK